MTNILTTLRGSGNVLVCVDTAGRVLELAHMVDQLWSNKDSGLLAYSLALLNNVAFNVVEFAKSQIDWMSEKLMNMMRNQRNNPFQFRHLKLCHSMAEVNKVPAPKVVLASMPDMECGFARELFLQWCSNPKNSVILTSRSSPGTLARDLIVNGGDRVIPLDVRRRIKLTGVELEEFRQKEKEKEKKTTASLVEAALDEESDSDTEMEVLNSKSRDKSAKVKHDIVMKPDSAKKQTGFFKSNKSRYPMYPCHEEKIKYDDYGEIIRLEDFMMDTSEPVNNLDSHVQHHQDEVEEEPIDKEEVPTKCVSSTQNFHVKCSIQFIDFEGRTDGESIAKLLAQLRPRRVILVRGSPSSLETLGEFCNEVVEGDNNIFVPKNGEVVDATTERFIYQIRLRDSLFSTLKFSKAKDAQLAWLDGLVKMTDDERTDLKPIEEANEDAELKSKQIIPILNPLPEGVVQGHSTNFVNELKLSDFKLVLTRNGIPSEFQAGNLMCGNNSNVQLRRHESGRVTIEGCVSDDYYLIRELLYQQYAIV